MVNTNRSRRGISLIEVLMSMLVFAAGATGASYLYMHGHGLIHKQDQYRVAAQLASEQLEKLKSIDYTEVGNQIVDANDLRQVIQDLTFTKTTTVKEIDSYPYKEVNVTVNWGASGTEHHVTLTTIIAP
ncbi:prepilin-type N-terminal cleavage/methylation domain-containing protein [Planctomycetota bacterium]